MVVNRNIPKTYKVFRRTMESWERRESLFKKDKKAFMVMLETFHILEEYNMSPSEAMYRSMYRNMNARLACG